MKTLLTPVTPGQRGAAATEYVIIAAAIAVALAVMGVAGQPDVMAQVGKAMSLQLSNVALLLNLPL